MEEGISLCVIARDEEKNLPRLLKSVQGAVDEVVLVDTGSRDETPEIARAFGARVFHHRWEGDFARARNLSLEKARFSWVLVLDADEELTPQASSELRSLLRRREEEGFFLTCVNLLEEGEEVRHPSFRLFRNRPRYRFRSAVHEQMAGVVMEAGGRVAHLPLQFRHHGYLFREAVGREKTRRNVEIIRRCLRENPDDSFMRFNLGMEYLRLRNFQGALEEFVRSFRSLPSVWAGYGHMLVRNIAVCLHYLGRHEELRRVVREAQGVYLGYTDLVFLEALSYLAEHRFREAEEGFRRCLDMGESSPEYMTEAGVGSHKALCGLGEAREAQGDLEGAVRHYLQAVEQRPSYLIPLRRLAALLLAEGAPTRASQVFARTPALYSPEAGLELSAIFLRAGCPEEAAFWAERARMMGAGDEARIQAARSLAFQGKKEEAVKVYLEVGDRQLRPRAASEAGIFLHLLGQRDEARKLWEEIEETDWRKGLLLLAAALEGRRDGRGIESPIAEQAVWDGLEILLRLGEFEAFERALGALEGLPLSPAEVQLRLGYLYFSADFPEMAREAWARALEEGVYDRQSLSFLGERCLEEGQVEEAVTILAGVLALDPKNERAYITLARALALAGREEEAREILEAGQTQFPGAERLTAAREALEVLAAGRRG